MGRLASGDSRRGASAAGGDALSAHASAPGTRAARVAARPRRALAAFASVCALLMLAASLPASRAQSGRRAEPPPIHIGKKGAPAPTPSPTPLKRPTGPIAEPPRP